MASLTTPVLAIVPDKRAERRIRKKLPGTRLVFANVAGAVDAATRSRPDVIVVDVEVPGSDGFHMLQTLQLRDETRDAGILWVTPSNLDRLQEAVASCSRERAMVGAVRDAIERVREQAAGATAALTLDERRVLESGGVPIGGQLALRPIAARAAKYQAILAGSLDASQAAKRLGVTTGRIRQRLLVDPPTLYGIRDGHTWRLPAFQFQSKGLVPNIERVIARLDRQLDPVAVDTWFRRPHVDLDQDGHPVSPLDWLAQGLNIQPVADLAEDL